ncbi:BolA/IbaG family iron-sulfur metabolism protein [Candidatus Bandiella numerosa]|jgi:stress-induced morphogen|uniref:BolA/IbaG family iron-sulfur metabolism protein n=1 Tax=Candidatus Bandiella numerosa TaxID=2570586 RepID=UPI001F1CC9BB|nr:BolA/IbaG family iron-sulfur metabolism protein [Candidatus Bandiella numerosa]
MPINYDVLYETILRGFPNSKIELVDTVGDNNHYNVKITSEKFNTLSRVEQHKLVHKVLKDCLGTDLHALSIQTFQTK